VRPSTGSGTAPGSIINADFYSKKLDCRIHLIQLLEHFLAHNTQKDIRPRWGRLVNTSLEHEYAIPMESD
jgi:hypothetical protein